MVYAWEGIKRLCCCSCGSERTLKLKEIIDYIVAEDKNGDSQLLFASSKNMESERYINGNPVSLAFTNISSMAAG